MAEFYPGPLTDHARRCMEFMFRAGQMVRTIPEIPKDEHEIVRVLKLMWEELIEVTDAFGYEAVISTDDQLARRMAFDEIEVVVQYPQFRYVKPGDLEKIADGFADLSVVNVCGMLACGLPDVPLLEEVDAANLRKFGPGGYRRADGKWIKPTDWVPPRIDRVLAEAVLRAT